MITLCIYTHGRDEYLAQTIESFNEMVVGPITKVIINDDSLVRNSYICDIVNIRNKSVKSTILLKSGGLGFAGAIDNVWTFLKTHDWDRTSYIFHLEDDFLFDKKIDLWEMMGIMDANPLLSQIALMRQPWNPSEIQAGSLYALHGEAFRQRQGKVVNHWQVVDGHDKWVEHNMWFTTNPCLYRRELIQEFDWPLCDQSEGIFTEKLREVGYKFGYLGTKEDEPYVTHIGKDRTDGKGY